MSQLRRHPGSDGATAAPTVGRGAAAAAGLLATVGNSALRAGIGRATNSCRRQRPVPAHDHEEGAAPGGRATPPLRTSDAPRQAPDRLRNWPPTHRGPCRRSSFLTPPQGRPWLIPRSGPAHSPFGGRAHGWAPRVRRKQQEVPPMTALELSRASARTDALFRAHHDEVYRTLLRDLGSPADAEDGTQAVFLSAFRSLERGCAPWSARAWLLAIAKNVARRAWRERARAAEGFEPDDVPAAEAPDEARRELFDALEALPAPQSRALLLHELCGMRYDEISESRSRPWQVSRRRSSALVVRFDPPSSTMERSATREPPSSSSVRRGKLTRQERQALQAHLVRCEECAALEAALRAPRLRRRLLGWLLSIPSVLQRVARRSSRPPAAASARPALPRRARGAASDGPAHGAPRPNRWSMPRRALPPAGRNPPARARCGDADAAGSSVDDRTEPRGRTPAAAPTHLERPARLGPAGTPRPRRHSPHTDPAVGVARRVTGTWGTTPATARPSRAAPLAERCLAPMP